MGSVWVCRALYGVYDDEGAMAGRGHVPLTLPDGSCALLRNLSAPSPLALPIPPPHQHHHVSAGTNRLAQTLRSCSRNPESPFQLGASPPCPRVRRDEATGADVALIPVAFELAHPDTHKENPRLPRR